MCGFVAWCSIADRGSLDCRRLRAATDLLRHRGPDDEGDFVSPEFAAGFRRLSILDLSDRGRQPMADESGRYLLVFNGEIYNYRELRKELEGLGWSFRTATDTEVLLKAYLQWGEACLGRLNGMFAFLLWDRHEKELFGARDRFGEKPLFYTVVGKTHHFASEIKALFPLLGRVPQGDRGVIREYLQFGRADFSTHTFFEGIHSFPPAHAFRLRDDRLEIRRYWRLEPGDGFRGDPVAEFRELFLDSIRLRTRSDVPVGTCLSGGVDSGSIVCGLARVLGTETGAVSRKTFTASFREYDESLLVAELNAASGSVGFSVTPEPAGLEILEEMLWYHDEPFHSLAAYASYEVMRLARREGVVVLLNGQGADELFAGYPKFIPYYLLSLLAGGKAAAARETLRQTGALTGRSTWALGLEALKLWVQGFLSDTAPLRARARWLRHREARSRFFLSEELACAPPPPASLDPQEMLGDPLKRRLVEEIRGTYLPLYLRVEDRNSMAHSLESRLPFLDHRLAELAFSVPSRCLMQAGYNKALLREAMRGILPESVRARREKFGFPVPQKRWLRTRLSEPLRELIDSTLTDDSGWFDPAALRQAFQRDLAASEGTDQGRWNDWFRVASVLLWRRQCARYPTGPSPSRSDGTAASRGGQGNPKGFREPVPPADRPPILTLP